MNRCPGPFRKPQLQTQSSSKKKEYTEAAASLAAANKISMGDAVEGILALALLISDFGESLKEQQARS